MRFCSVSTIMFPFSKRLAGFLHRLIKAMTCSGGARGRRLRRSDINWPSLSSVSAEEVSKQVFRLIDSNGDGRISPLELGDVLRCLGQGRSAAAREAEGMVRVADCDGDGFIDLNEFTEAVGGGEMACSSREELVQAFQVFHADGNGFISPEELRRMLVMLGCRNCSLRDCRRMIGGVDRNGDGLVDFDEFWCMMTYELLGKSTSFWEGGGVLS